MDVRVERRQLKHHGAAGHAAGGRRGEADSSSKLQATVIRGVLFLPKATSLKPQAASLLDISGRKVLDLHPGANDVSRLSPGVYFVREAQAQAVRKVVITE